MVCPPSRNSSNLDIVIHAIKRVAAPSDPILHRTVSRDSGSMRPCARPVRWGSGGSGQRDAARRTYRTGLFLAWASLEAAPLSALP